MRKIGWIRIRKISPKQRAELALRRKIREKWMPYLTGVCPQCGRAVKWPGISFSHEIPLAHGGQTTFENYVPRCNFCHNVLRHHERIAED